MSYYSKKGYYSKKIPSQKHMTLNDFRGVPINCFDSSKRTAVIYGKDKIKEDLINLLSIDQGSVFFNPELGSSLYTCLFEINDFILRDTIRYKVTEAVVRYIPQIEVEGIDIKQDPDNSLLAIKVKYTITSLGLDDEITVYKDIRERFGGD